MTEDYIIIAIIQYALLMSGSESRDCYHSAFHRIYIATKWLNLIAVVNQIDKNSTGWDLNPRPNTLLFYN